MYELSKDFFINILNTRIMPKNLSGRPRAVDIQAFVHKASYQLLTD